MKKNILFIFYSCIAINIYSQNLSGTIVYSRGTLPNGSIWVNNGSGIDSMLFSNGMIPRISPSGNYMLYMKNTVPSNPTYGGQWARRNLITQTDTAWSNGNYIVGYDFLGSDSSIIISSNCGIYHVTFDNVSINTVVQVDCWDDAPEIRQTDSMVVYCNIHYNMKLAKTDGSNTSNIPNTEVRDVWPAWSPDGQWIAFQKLNPAMTIEQNVFKIKPDGTGLTQLSNFASSDTMAGGLAWSPDGMWVITGGIVGGVQSLYAVKADGSGMVVTIPTTPGDPIQFVGEGGNFLASSIESEKQHEAEIFSVMNPAGDNLEINFKEFISDGKLICNDILGKTILKKDLKNIFGKYSTDISYLANGVYTITIESKAGVETKKIIKH